MIESILNYDNIAIVLLVSAVIYLFREVNSLKKENTTLRDQIAELRESIGMYRGQNDLLPLLEKINQKLK